LVANLHSFTRDEIAPIIVVSLISALRLLGIFLILPIFSVYAVRYPGASAALAGVAFGVYALVQCVFQIPLGWASDRWGRKPVLIGGLVLFVLGSIACALATDIYGLIFARALQGAGAVGSVAFAALADLTRSNVRAQAYTVTGVAIGAAFAIGLLAGPFLAAQIGLGGLFYLLAFLGCLSVLLAIVLFPAGAEREPRAESRTPLRPILLHDHLRPIFIATFVLSFALNLFFFTYPLSWNGIGLPSTDLWKVYLIIFLPSILFVFPYMRRVERIGRFRGPLLLGWMTATFGYGVYLFGAQYDLLLYLGGAAFFFGYSIYQPILPAFLTRRVPAHGRGTASGVYNSFAFIGSSLGGIVAGALIHVSPSLPEFLGVLLLLIWYWLGLPIPPESSS
jgi:MFS family permease